MFNIELFLKMNEQLGESGAHTEEDKNEVQAPDLLVRRRQVYPKKPRYNLLTPDQLKDKKKAASVQRKEKRIAFKNTLTPDQLKDKKKAASDQLKVQYPKKPRYNLLTPDQLKDKKKAVTVRRKEKRVAFENLLTPDQLKDKKKAATVRRKEKRVAFENSLTPDQLKDKKKCSHRSKKGEKGCLRKLIDSG